MWRFCGQKCAHLFKVAVFLLLRVRYYGSENRRVSIQTRDLLFSKENTIRDVTARHCDGGRQAEATK